MQKIEIVDNKILSSDYYNLNWPQPSKSYSIWIRAEEKLSEEANTTTPTQHKTLQHSNKVRLVGRHKNPKLLTT